MLLDEIEKAHNKIFSALLQLLDDGRMTDGQGRVVDFRNTVIIMTSNIDGPPSGYFRPEFLNRIDDIVDFHPLDQSHMEGIVRIQLGYVVYQAQEHGLKVQFTQEAINYLATVGFDPKYGARPLRRAIQTSLLDPLSLYMMSNKAKSLMINREADKLVFTQN